MFLLLLCGEVVVLFYGQLIKSMGMLTFETYQTVPMIALSDMDPYLSSQEGEKDFPMLGEEATFVRLDLSRALIKNPAHTFFIQLTEDTMTEEGVYLGDLLIVDRVVEARNNALVIAYLDGLFTLRRIRYEEEGIVLYAGNPDYAPVEIEPDMEFGVWGVVRDVIHGAV